MTAGPSAAGGARGRSGRGGRRCTALCALGLALAQGACSVAPEDIRYRESRQAPVLQIPADLTRPATGAETAVPVLPGGGAPDPWGTAERADAIERPPAMVME